MLATLGFSVRRLSPEDRQYVLSSYNTAVELPPGALAALRADNADLLSLRQRYRESGLAVTQHSLWSDDVLSRELDLPWFRGDNAYVWQFRQLRTQARLKQYLMLLDVRQWDVMGLLPRLHEDGLFGCWTFEYADTRPISRDLLDSVREINYLERHLALSQIEQLSILDIGAGYGRLAHRMSEALPNLAVYDCVDAVAESTFLCDYYLRFRQLQAKARSVPLTDFPSYQPDIPYHLAVNIHSFTECTRDAICWWLDSIRQRQIPYLLIVPNDSDGLRSSEADGSRIDCNDELPQRGYRLMNSEYVIADPALRELIAVHDRFFLYQLDSASESP